MRPRLPADSFSPRPRHARAEFVAIRYIVAGPGVAAPGADL